MCCGRRHAAIGLSLSGPALSGVVSRPRHSSFFQWKCCNRAPPFTLRSFVLLEPGGQTAGKVRRYSIHFPIQKPAPYLRIIRGPGNDADVCPVELPNLTAVQE